jgi:hypothetical protein
MSETLGMLCDKLTIVKLKEYHTNNEEKLNSLFKQAQQLQNEIDEYIYDALKGRISIDKLSFDSNKVYIEKGNEMRNFEGSFGDLISSLADTNCKLWHTQEKVYEFEKVEVKEKDNVIKELAILNLERNQCIDKINNMFKNFIKNKYEN